MNLTPLLVGHTQLPTIRQQALGLSQMETMHVKTPGARKEPLQEVDRSLDVPEYQWWSFRPQPLAEVFNRHLSSSY